MKKKLTSMLLICLLLAAAAVLTACGEKPEPAQPLYRRYPPLLTSSLHRNRSPHPRCRHLRKRRNRQSRKQKNRR